MQQVKWLMLGDSMVFITIPNTVSLIRCIATWSIQQLPKIEVILAREN